MAGDGCAWFIGISHPPTLGSEPLVVGGIIPPEDAELLKAAGAAAVYTPKDFQLNDIMADIVRLIDSKAKAA